jgi:hypothetical protein
MKPSLYELVRAGMITLRVSSDLPVVVLGLDLISLRSSNYIFINKIVKKIKIKY